MPDVPIVPAAAPAAAPPRDLASYPALAAPDKAVAAPAPAASARAGHLSAPADGPSDLRRRAVPPAAVPRSPEEIHGAEARAEADAREAEDLAGRRTRSEELSNKSWLTFDGYIIKLSSGAFGLSITVITDIFAGKVNGPVSRSFLGAAFFLLLYSILLTVGSYIASYLEHKKFVDHIDRALADYQAGKGLAVKGYRPRTTLRLNIASFIAFGLGLVCLTVFILMNI